MQTTGDQAPTLADSRAEPPPMVYGPPPKVGDYLMALYNGRPLFIESRGRYPILIRKWKKICEEKGIRGKKLSTKKCGFSKWQVFIVDATAAKFDPKKGKKVTRRPSTPEVAFEPGFDPLHGRYKRLAKALTESDCVLADNYIEAQKIMAAFRLHETEAKKIWRLTACPISNPPREGLSTAEFTKLHKNTRWQINRLPIAG